MAAQMRVSKSWRYTLVGLTVGFIVAAVMYLFAGDVVVVLFVRTVEKVLSIIVGLIRLKSH